MRALTRLAAGFTLIELMVTILIGAILLSIGAPMYQAQIRKSRRTDAKTAILDLAGREERLFSTTNSYSADATQLGYPANGFASIGSGYYSLAVTAPLPAAPAAGALPALATFTITATAIGTQLKDTQCISFKVDQTGQQSSLDANGVDSSATCLK